MPLVGYTLRRELLKQWLRDVFSAAGLDRSDAQDVARSLYEAEIRGVLSHGLLLLPMYLDRIAQGVIKTAYEITVTSARGACISLDGGSGPGQVILFRAVAEAERISKDHGIGLAVACNSNHVGMLATFALDVAARGLIAIVATNTGPSVGAFGGNGQLLGNNAFCVAAPNSGGPSVCLDMATATVATGKVRVAELRGDEVPDTWIVDASGQPARDPSVLHKGGWATPLGGYKGYGLAVVVDLLTALLSGGPSSPKIENKKIRPGSGMGFSQTVIVIDPTAAGRTAYSDSVAAYVDLLQKSPSINPEQRLLVPGEIEHSSDVAAGEYVHVDDAILKRANASVVAHQLAVAELG